MWRVGSMQEAADWLKRAFDGETEVEIRPVFEAEEFGENLTPEAREREAHLRAKLSADK
jgi:hypothetical protein